MKATAVELEIDGAGNECLHFRPLERKLRGRLDLTRVKEPLAAVEAQKWPKPIPSQRLGIDAMGIGYLLEPLHDADNTALREKITKQGMGLEPARMTFEGIDLPTWYFWLQRAVESGIAKVISGKLPERIEGKPRMNFVMAEPEPSTSDRLTAAIERQNDLMARLLERIAK